MTMLETTRRSQSSATVFLYVVYACSVMLIIAFIFVGLEVSISRGWPGAAGQMVSRTGKGDFLRSVPAFHRNAVNQPGQIGVLRTLPPDRDLIDGCESLASSLAGSPLALIAGRCLS
jgi:hypothetical protein